MKWSDYYREVLERCQKATLGPWYESGGRTNVIQTDHITRDVWTICEVDLFPEADRPFIAHSRTDVERLAKRCLELEEALKFYAQSPVPDKESIFAKSAEEFGEHVATWEPLLDMGDQARVVLKKEIE